MTDRNEIRPTPPPTRRALAARAALAAALVAAAALAAPGCAAEPVRPAPSAAGAQPRALGLIAAGPATPAPAALLAAAPSPAEPTVDYRIGPGDGLRVTVVGQRDLSGEFTVGPDGSISMPLAGTVSLQGLTRDQAAALISARLAAFFLAEPRASVDVTRYLNNKAYVLGRVERPGVVELTGRGTLLQAISEAGGLPVREFRSFLARCAIIRGRDEIIWIDLLDLLQRGNIALNVPLRNGDIVYLPDAEDASVFVMGEVRTPGAVPIRVRLSLTQALAQAGGPGEDAKLDEVYVLRDAARGGAGAPRRIDFERLLDTADFAEDLELQAGDIVYVVRNGLGDVNYVLRKLQPAIQAVAIGAGLAK